MVRVNIQAWRHFYRGRLLEICKRSKAAAEAYRLALRLDPRFARAATALGYLCAREKNYLEAERWLAEGTRLTPGKAAAWFNLGFAREALGRREQAIEAFSEAVRLDRLLDRAWYGMGMCHAALGRHEEAAKALEEAATLQPMNPYAWYQLGMAHHVLRNADKVKEVIEYLFRFDPKMTRKLIQDTSRSDLAHLVKDLLV